MDSATDIKQRAQRLIRSGDLAPAMQEYRRLTREESVDPNVHILIGDLHLRMGQRDGAIEEYGKAADGYDGLGLLRNAIAVHKKVLRVYPRHPSAHQRLADLYARKGHLTESVSHHLDHAALRLEGDDEETAREILEQVTQLSTPSARVALRLADLYLVLGDRGRAVHELQRLARELEIRGRPDQARKLLDQARIIDPEFSPTATGGAAAEPVELAAEPVELAAEPVELAAEPVELAAEPVEEHTELVEEQAEPAEAEAGSTEEQAEPAEAEAGSTEDQAEPAEAEAGPTEEQAEPAEAEAGPAQHGVLPGLERVSDLFSPVTPREDGADGNEQTSSDTTAIGDTAASDDQSSLFADPAHGLIDEPVDDPSDAPVEHAAEHEKTAVIISGSDTWQTRLDCLLESGDEQGAMVWLDQLAAEAEEEGRHDEAITLLERLWELGRRNRDVAHRLVKLTAVGAPPDRAAHWLAELTELELSAGTWSAARAGYGRVLELDDAHEPARRRLERLDQLDAQTTSGAEQEEPAGALFLPDALDAVDPDGGEPEADVPDGGDPLAVDNRVAGLPEPGDDAMPTPDHCSEEDQIDRLLTRFRQEIGAQLGDEDHAAHYDLAIAYVEMGLEREALAELKVAAGSHIYHQRCLELQATCYSRLGEPTNAIDCLRVALEEIGPVDSRGADLRVCLGTALMEAGALDEARNVLRGVIDQHPAHADARSQLEALGG